MSAAVVIYQILSAETDITDIVGSGNDCRVFPAVSNKNYDIPYITYQQIVNVPNPSKSGVSTLDEDVYQINIAAKTRAQCDTLAELVRIALDYATGTYSGSVLQLCVYQTQRDLWYENAQDDGLIVVSQDYKFFMVR